jgi:hypothetical protein
MKLHERGLRSLDQARVDLRSTIGLEVEQFLALDFEMGEDLKRSRRPLSAPLAFIQITTRNHAADTHRRADASWPVQGSTTDSAGSRIYIYSRRRNNECYQDSNWISLQEVNV